MSGPHDNAYKLLFAHPQAVHDLLRGFVHEDWVEQLDWDTLERVNGSYVSDDLREREDDIIWRLRRQAGQTVHSPHDASEWVYVYLLLEFQSSVDAFMAVRMLTYIGLLYQDLIKAGQVRARRGPHSGRLPAVFPLVLYNGEAPWTAECEMERLIEAVPASLAAYRPRLRYFVLDEGRLSEASLQQPGNAVASLVQIERVNDPAELARVVGRLQEQLKAPHNAQLRRAFAVWIKRVVLRRFDPQGDLPDVQDLPEVHQMIGERIDAWRQELLRQGQEQGLQQGMQQGMQQGQADLLRRLLARRFGPVPAEIEARIAKADLQQIEQWFDRSMDAASLAAVFGMH